MIRASFTLIFASIVYIKFYFLFIISIALCLLQIETEEEARLMFKIVLEHTLAGRAKLAITNHFVNFIALTIAAGESIHERHQLYVKHMQPYAHNFEESLWTDLEKEVKAASEASKGAETVLSEDERKFLMSKYMVHVFSAVVDSKIDALALRKNAGDANASVMAILIPNFIVEMRELNHRAHYVLAIIGIATGVSWVERPSRAVFDFVASTSMAGPKDWSEVAHAVMCTMEFGKWNKLGQDLTPLWKLHIRDFVFNLGNIPIINIYYDKFAELISLGCRRNVSKYIPDLAERLTADGVGRKKLMDHADEILEAAADIDEIADIFLNGEEVSPLYLKAPFRMWVMGSPDEYAGYGHQMAFIKVFNEKNTTISLTKQSPKFWSKMFAELCVGSKKPYTIFKSMLPQFQHRYDTIMKRESVDDNNAAAGGAPAAGNQAAALPAGAPAGGAPAGGVPALPNNTGVIFNSNLPPGARHAMDSSAPPVFVMPAPVVPATVAPGAVAPVAPAVPVVPAPDPALEELKRVQELEFFKQMDLGIRNICLLTSREGLSHAWYAAVIQEVCDLAGVFDLSQSQWFIYEEFLAAFHENVFNDTSKKLVGFFLRFSFEGVPDDSVVHEHMRLIMFGKAFVNSLRTKIDRPVRMKDSEFVNRMLRSLLRSPQNEAILERMKRLIPEFAEWDAEIKKKFTQIYVKIFTEEPTERTKWFIHTIISDPLARHELVSLADSTLGITPDTKARLLTDVIMKLYKDPPKENTLQEDQVHKYIKKAASRNTRSIPHAERMILTHMYPSR